MNKFAYHKYYRDRIEKALALESENRRLKDIQDNIRKELKDKIAEAFNNTTQLNMKSAEFTPEAIQAGLDTIQKHIEININGGNK